MKFYHDKCKDGFDDLCFVTDHDDLDLATWSCTNALGIGPERLKLNRCILVTLDNGVKYLCVDEREATFLEMEHTGQ